MTMFRAMPDLDLGPKQYRWLGGRALPLLEKRWFRRTGYVTGFWAALVIGLARYVFTPAPLWPTVVLSLTPFLAWLLVLIWTDTAA
jgi:hypothetical protein